MSEDLCKNFQRVGIRMTFGKSRGNCPSPYRAAVAETKHRRSGTEIILDIFTSIFI